MHFLYPGFFTAIVPPHMGDPVIDVQLSGAAEVSGGIGLLLPGTRAFAAVGLFALLIAVWPANWYMAIQAQRFAAIAPAWVLWARLPLQVAFMIIVLRVGKTPSANRP